MKRKIPGFILLGCCTIIVISFVKFSIAKTVKGKKSASKGDSDDNKSKDKCLKEGELYCGKSSFFTKQCCDGLTCLDRAPGTWLPHKCVKKGHKSRTPDCFNWECTHDYRPVCGSDGKTYSNKCSLESTAACEDGKQDLVIASEGECSGERNCVKNHMRCCKMNNCNSVATEHCSKKPLCTELACNEKKCGDECNVSHWKRPGKCNSKGYCSKKTKNLKCSKGNRKGQKPVDVETKCRNQKKCKGPCDTHCECHMYGRQCHCTCVPEMMDGRPFVVDGRYRATTSLIGETDESNAKTEWNIDQVPGILANSSLNQEIALAFSNQGEGEHASVASFARHTLQLMSMGAPATLLIGSQQAALDEIRHAKMCYGIAKSFLGAKIQPNTLNIDGSVKTMRKSEIIQSVITEGCIGETVAAVRAQLSAHYAKEQKVKSILEEIASDETNHSQLAWKTVQWAINRFPELRVIAEETFRPQLDRPVNMANGLPTDYCYDCEKGSALHDHGLLLDTDKDTTENLGIQNVIKPVVLNEFLNVDTISTQILNMDFSKYQ